MRLKKELQKACFAFNGSVGFLGGAGGTVKVIVAQLCLLLWNPMEVARLAPLSMEFSRKKYYSR